MILFISNSLQILSSQQLRTKRRCEPFAGLIDMLDELIEPVIELGDRVVIHEVVYVKGAHIRLDVGFHCCGIVFP